MQISVLWIVAIHKDNQSTNVDSGAIEDVNEGSDAVKNLMQSGKAGLMRMHVYSNH